MQLTHLARAALHHRLPQAHLPIAHDDDFAAVTKRQYGRSVHHNKSLQARAVRREAREKFAEPPYARLPHEPHRHKPQFLSSSARMRLIVDRRQRVQIQMGIFLRRRQARRVRAIPGSRASRRRCSAGGSRKLWRRPCGPILTGMPACFKCFSTMRATLLVVIRAPRLFKKHRRLAFARRLPAPALLLAVVAAALAGRSRRWGRSAPSTPCRPPGQCRAENPRRPN